MRKPSALIVGILFSAASAALIAAPHDDVVAALSKVSTAPAIGLTASLQESAGTYAVGAPIEVRLGVRRPAYLSLVYVDAHGMVSTIDPIIGPAGNLISADTQYLLPTDDTPISVLRARPPEGAADLFVIASEKRRAAGGGSGAGTSEQMIAAKDSVRFAQALASDLGGGSAGMVAVQHLKMRVQPHGGKGEYSVQEIVQYFTQTTRSVDRPRLDLYVNFRFNSADITPDSVPRLDTWGRVLSDPLMGQQSFVIGGHTDDVGTEDYNQELSVRRARAVKDFLVSKYGIAPSRLDVSGYGKARPLVQGTSDAERSANRRVDFERLTRPGQARP